MAEIGELLREARMRERIDITEIEAQTKIRAKYLRALENEEWDLLPGPTFVKTFLRTYAEALGLDAKAIVNEYKLRYEHPGDLDLQPIRPTGRHEKPRTRDYSPPAAPWLLGGGLVLALIAVLWVLGSSGPSKKPPAPVVHVATTPVAPVVHKHKRPRVALQIVATGPVTVCLVNATAGKVINARTLLAGGVEPIYRSVEFLITLSNGNAELRVDGRLQKLQAGLAPQGYEVRRSGVKALASARWPKCA